MSNGQPWVDAYTNPLEHKGAEKEIDPNAEEFQRIAREDYELCVHFAKTFRTKSGKKVLAFLREATIESGAWMSSIGSSRDDRIDHAFAREGQNAMVKDIERRIEVAENCKSVEDYLDYIALKGTGK